MSHNFQVDDLGPNVPAASFVFAAEQANRLVGIGISAFSSDNDDAITATIDALRAVTDVAILVGGPAIAGQEARSSARCGWIRCRTEQRPSNVSSPKAPDDEKTALTGGLLVYG